MESSFQKTLPILLQKDSFCLWLLFAFILLVVSPIFYWGIPDGYDLPFHFQDSINYYEAFKSGNFFPSWTSTTNYGYGDVALRFYPPLSHYFLAFTQFLTDDWMITSRINILFWMFSGSVGSYLFARLWLSPQESLLVGILYAIAPYHLTQIYQYFLYSEFAAAGVLPFCFLFTTRVCRNGKLEDVVLLGFFAALLILTNIPTSIIGIICLGLFAVLIIEPKEAFKIAPRLLSAGIFTLVLTSFYWLRLITEVSWVNHSSQQFFSGQYSFQQGLFPFFIHAGDYYLIKQFWFRDLVGIFTYLLLVPITVYLFKRNFPQGKIRREIIVIFIVGLFAALMSTNLSFFLWDNLAFLQKIQFPFRWLSVVTFFGVFGFVWGLKNINSSPKIKEYSLIAFFTLLSLFTITQIILPAGLLDQTKFNERLTDLREGESFDSWFPTWGKREAFEQKTKVVAENRNVKINLWNAENREFEVEPGEKIAARIATFYYPHWQATVNGEKTKVELNPDGTMTIPVPSEAAKVSLTFQEPFVIKTGRMISAMGWILLILAALYLGFDKYRNSLLSNK